LLEQSLAQLLSRPLQHFGFDGWQRQTIAIRCVAQAESMLRSVIVEAKS